MRRVLSIFLLGVLVWSLVTPFALGLTTSAPASCCRRNGKHHCMSGRSGVAADDPQPALRSVPFRCPYSSQIATTTLVVRLQASRASARHAQSEILAVQTD